MPYADPTSQAARESGCRASRRYFEKNKDQCRANHRQWWRANRGRCLEYQRAWTEEHRDHVNQSRREISVTKGLLAQAKQRAKARGLEFELVAADIIVPELCPILGIRLARSPRRVAPHSPSLDRKNPRLGYVKGNVQVISHRANTLKSNATVLEMRAVLAHLEAADGSL